MADLDYSGSPGCHTDFAERIIDWLGEGNSIKEMLLRNGADIIEQKTRHISLRELARRTGLSPTYLSQVSKGRASISPRAFVKIAQTDALLHNS